MTISLPHWATALVAAIGACAGALVSVFPQYATIFGAVASVAAILAAPTLTSKP